MKEKHFNDVVIINNEKNYSQQNQNSKDIDSDNNSDTQQQATTTKKTTDSFNIKVQTKVFSVLLMIFSVLLFLALISHTSKDEPNTQFRFLDLFGLFSNEPAIKIKFDTTLNLVGLIGAYLSDILINRTIGILIIGMPIFLFIWGYKLYKIGEVPNNIIKGTIKYIIISLIISCIIGSLSNFSSLQNIPIECYGTIGVFMGTMVSKTISPIGATIVFVGLLVFYLIKFTNITKKSFIDALKNNIKEFRINNIAQKINSYFIKNTNEVKSKIKNATYSNKNNDSKKPHPENIVKEKVYDAQTKPTVTNTSQSQHEKSPINITYSDSSATQNVVQADKPTSQKQVENVPNIFIKANSDTDVTSNLQNNIPSKNIINDNDNDNLLLNFKGKTKLKIIDDESIFSNSTSTHNVENSENISNEKQQLVPQNATVIDEAVFTFQPPVNIELPKQSIYVPTPQTDLDLENIIAKNPPIKIDFTDNYSPTVANDVDNSEVKPKLIIEVDKSEEAAQMQNKNNLNDSDVVHTGLKNPLNLKMHDEKINFKPPTLDLLDIGSNENFADDEELQRNGRILQEKLQTFKINISNLEVTRGPVVTQYEFVPADGIMINKIERLSDDLSMALKAKSVHIIAPVPEKGTVGIQIPNAKPSIVRFRSVISSPAFIHSNFELPLALGKTVSGEPYITDLAKTPHLLIAGSTGAGKSVGINTIISSLLYKKHPSQLKFVIIDPKKVELTHYARLSSHFLAVSPDINSEIVTEPQDAITVLKASVLEMEKRYTLLEIAKQKNIKDYNEKVREGAFRNDVTIDHRELPYIVIVVDELADLMLTAGRDIETPIVRLAQMARAVGIHLIIATQRPSVNIITGIIKANFPARIAYLVAQKVDSRTILDGSGAEALLGNGDMLFKAANLPKAIRIQNPFISTDEVERICDYIGNQEGYSAPYMLPSTFEAGNEGEYDASVFDPLFREAAELIIGQQQASTSMLQRRLKIGFARAGRIMDELAAAGVIGPSQGSKPRAVLLESVSDLERIFMG